ncbi:MAG: transposase [Arenibacterium sp.]
MNQDARPNPAGATYFFTAELSQKNSTLLVDQIDALFSAIEATEAAMPFYTDAWVVMPDHLHMVWTMQPEDDEYAQRWVQIKRRFTMSLPQNAREAGIIWKRGVAVRQVTGLLDYSEAIRRCWFDPVRHELARIPEDWKYSSAHLQDEKVKLVA